MTHRYDLTERETDGKAKKITTTNDFGDNELIIEMSKLEELNIWIKNVGANGLTFRIDLSIGKDDTGTNVFIEKQNDTNLGTGVATDPLISITEPWSIQARVSFKSQVNDTPTDFIMIPIGIGDD